MIDGVVFEDIPGAHDDERRTLTPVFNMDLVFRPAEQLKIAHMKIDGVLGRHYHAYGELFTVASGQAAFTLTDRETREQETYLLVPGKRLLVPAGLLHEAKVVAGTILIGLTERRYVDAATNDLKD